jgi:hypothetical protein
MVAENSRGLALPRHQLYDALQRVNEAKIEHPVGLVQHKNLDIRQNEALSLDQIEEAPRGRYENVDTRRELSLLGPDRDTPNTTAAESRNPRP